MSQTALAFGISRPSTLDEALNVIDRLSGAVATQLANGIDKARWPSSARDGANLMEGLIRTRRAIKAGKTDDALYELERALSELDSGWMCRA